MPTDDVTVSRSDRALLTAFVPLGRRQNLWGSAAGKLMRDRVAAVSILVIFLVVISSLLAPLLAPHDPLAQDVPNRLKGVGTEGHLLGTDQFGRDILSRMLWGGRNSLQVALIPVLLTFVIAMTIGLIAGYNAGIIDTILMRLMDVFLAFLRFSLRSLSPLLLAAVSKMQCWP